MSSITSFPTALKVDIKLAGLISEISEKVKQIPNYESLRNDIEIILFICNSIENECIKKNIKLIKNN